MNRVSIDSCRSRELLATQRRPRLWAATILASIAWLLLGLVACEGERDSTTQPAGTSALRIVSLSPAISRTLVDLELAKFVVGRTPYCTSLDSSVPVVGDLLSIDYEQLIRSNPTHVLVQPPADGIDRTLVQLATQRGWAIADWQLNGLADIRAVVAELPAQLHPKDDPARSSLQQKSDALIADLNAALASPFEDGWGYRESRSVLMVNAVDPVMAFGVGTYLDDLLQAFGEQNVVKDRGWVQLSLEDIVRLAPEAIILVKPDADPAKLTNDLGPLATIDVPAVKADRIAVLGDHDALLPSSAVVNVARELRAILERFADGGAAADNRP